MWEWNNYANIPDDELYHYGILGMHWGIRKAGKYFTKAGENYGMYLKYKDKSEKAMKKGVKKSLTTIYDKKNNNATHVIKMKTLKKYEKKCEKYQKLANKHLALMNSYNKQGISTMNKYNINKGKDFIYKKFDRGLISGRTNNAYVLGGAIGGTIGAYKSYKTLKNEGHLHEEYYNKR